MLRPVELYASRYPRTCQTHQGGLDDVVVIYEVALLQLVVGHLYPAAQFGQDHYLYIFVLYPNGQILLVYLLIAHRLDDGIRIHYTTRTLIHSLLKEHRALLGTTHLISGYRD